MEAYGEEVEVYEEEVVDIEEEDERHMSRWMEVYEEEAVQGDGGND
jgi:hypothetical protein